MKKFTPLELSPTKLFNDAFLLIRDLSIIIFLEKNVVKFINLNFYQNSICRGKIHINYPLNAKNAPN